ncbi:MAG TPA: alpha-L-fucosidase [Bryobacteraceae bacterium]|nr:alpha-L-fucosidase [Bryobacteraceae bacterium]
MNRRSFHTAIGGLAVAATCRALRRTSATHFQPEWQSLEQHSVPQWFNDAKLGIFIHWGLYSVPAWAPPTGELGKIDWNTWFANNPYAEWYLNSLRITGSPTYRHHVATYGRNFDYYQFTPTFDEQTTKWQPEQWAALFKQTGARYVVLTTKHHDGFRLWPSAVVNPKARGRQLNAKRDIAGELAAAVRSAGIKMGLYYSGGLDWTFTDQPIRTRPDLLARVPQSQEYASYADAHWRELIARYRPSVLWNDISYPKLGQTAQIFAEYYNSVPDGVINNRFSVPFADFTTPEYARYDKITEKKWESCRGLGFSFGYNQVEGPEQVIAPDKLIALLVDIVSKNGNLLLNVGPKADGSISAIQADRLHKLGDWLSINGEAIFGTRPWIRPSASAPDGSDVRFTRKQDSLYAHFLKYPPDRKLTIPGLRATPNTVVEIFGFRSPCSIRQNGSDLLIESAGVLPTSSALVAKIKPVPAAV